MKNLKIILTLILLSVAYIARAQSTESNTASTSEPDSVKYEKELMEVVVKASRKYVKPTSRGIKVSMVGNPVAKLGSASEALKQLPMIDASKGDIEVLGYGSPQIYINNKLVRNTSELAMLSAENLKDVEILTNPS